MTFAAVHRAAGRAFAPWKNGGGETAEILCHPEGAGFDGFGWRISTARVAANGPFSRFDGVARVLAVLEGGPLELRLAGRAVVLDQASAPFAFDGGEECAGILRGPAVLDLNVMARPPFAVSVARGAVPAAVAGRVVARLVLALEDVPALGLSRHDLAQLTGGADWPASMAGLVGIAVGRVSP
jgi:environmental stress-induced protein Ves